MVIAGLARQLFIDFLNVEDLPKGFPLPFNDWVCFMKRDINFQNVMAHFPSDPKVHASSI